ncbi:hypothetical protein L1987_43199 [Smallanthus sonchifolius]|uniref:Uncharacterized protein n=1 Tax=Smallanthus sonchifolius TaxID=185202 RepID=A0ACB9GN09_9ASTR|nr:hypothetical protein L1987_43199 [Smallanthus sonchifolius]
MSNPTTTACYAIDHHHYLPSSEKWANWKRARRHVATTIAPPPAAQLRTRFPGARYARSYGERTTTCQSDDRLVAYGPAGSSRAAAAAAASALEAAPRRAEGAVRQAHLGVFLHVQAAPRRLDDSYNRLV